MPLIYQYRFYREDVIANKGVTYVFGDNTERKGYGGQAAACRGLANTIGIPTKKAPALTPEAFFDDKELPENRRIIDAGFEEVVGLLNAGQLVIYPLEGLGTGYAKMEERCPLTYDIVQTWEEKLNVYVTT